jgi:hypothetical protein
MKTKTKKNTKSKMKKNTKSKIKKNTKSKIKKNIKSKKTKTIKKNNNKKDIDVENCMNTYVKKKVDYWINDDDKEIADLEKKKKLTKEEKTKLEDLKKKRKEQQIYLEDQYKLYNCNINCKNTLLEPGPPDYISKYMRKKLGNSKELIDIFTKKRKEIFKNKENVLIDNFYEKTPDKIKNQFLKEGAISNCILPLPNNQSGGSYIFKNGSIIKTDETFNGKPFFRKVFYYSNPPTKYQIQAAETEFKIANILIKNPFPNIVTFYEIDVFIILIRF